MAIIPPELLRPIVEHLDDDTESLLAISLVSHEFRAEGQRAIFQTMYLPMDKDAHIKFLTAITSSSVLAEYVEEFQQFELINPKRQEDPLWELTCRGLTAMVNLKHLLFRAVNGTASGQILRGCTFRLEILRWDNFYDDGQLVELLKAQPKLRILGTKTTIPPLNDPDICPRLQVLHSNQRTIDAVLPGRRITSIKWLADLEEIRRDAPVYTPPQEFHHVRYLSFGGYFGRPLLSVVANHLPALEVLEVLGLHHVNELLCLPQIPFLRVFILSNPSASCPGNSLSLRERKACFPQIFEVCENLQHIDIELSIQGRGYQRWLRDGSPLIEISDVDEVLLPEWEIS